MSRTCDERRMDELLEKYCQGTLTSLEAEALNVLLEGDRAKQHYLEFMETHSRLSRLLAPSKSSTQISSLSFSSVRRNDWRNWPTVAVLLTLAAALVVLAAMLIPGRFEPETFTAKIVKKIDCDVDFSRWNSVSTDKLNAGQVLSVKRGLLSVEFGCGATVAIQGPAEFKIVSDKKGFLQFGNLTAKAPPQAKGFTIETPSCQSVDLGTEFGMRVDLTGTSETHVFEGEVLVFEKNSALDREEDALKLIANQASRVVDDLQSAVEMQANPKSFLRLPEAIDNRMVSSNVPFRSEHQPILWYDASKYVETDESSRVVSWQDLTANGNWKPENAWQVESNRRPFLVPEAIGDRPAVRFMGNEFMVTEPLSSGDQLTLFAVVKMLPQQLRRMRHAGLICSSSPYGVRLFRDPKNYLTSKVNGYWKDGKETHAAWNMIRTDLQGVPLVLGMVYDRKNNVSQLLVNGQVVRRSDAWAAIAMEKSFYIGSLLDGESGIVGDIAEILIMNSALESSDLQGISAWLMEKYSLVDQSLAIDGFDTVDANAEVEN